MLSFGLKQVTLAKSVWNVSKKSFSTSLPVSRIKKYHRDFPDAVGIECHGFTYYPRPGEVEPNIKPSKLFMVQRTHSLFGQPYWIKDTIEKLKLHRDEVDKVVLKNTPLINKLLWEVKHIVKITPITFPYGEPKEGDQGFLNDDGQYILIKKLQNGVDEQRYQASVQFYENHKRLDADTIKKKLRDVWLTSRK